MGQQSNHKIGRKKLKYYRFKLPFALTNHIHSIKPNMKRNFTTYHSSIVLFLVILTASLGINEGHAQSVGIASTTITPDAQSILDIQSTSKGVLLPRMTSAQRAAISPTNGSDLGLSVYDTDTDSYWYWDGTVWQEIPNTSGIVTTLDGAYDGGGSGVGRIISADAGAVDIQGVGGLLVSGQTAINTTPQSNFKLSVLANSGTQGVYILASGGSGGTYGLHSTTATANYTPIFGENTSTSTGSAYSAVRGALSTPVATNGYLGYHTTGNNSYAVFGTGGTYAGYFNGNTIVTGGNLGVGVTTAATERLQVAGNVYLSASNPILLAGNAFDITGTSGVDIVIDSDNNSTNAAFRVQKDAGTTLFELQEDNDIFFADLAGGGTQLLQADNLGQVTLSSLSSTNLISGTGAPTQIAYFDGTQSITSEASLFWDPTNNRLGIGTNIPNTSLEIQVPENGSSLNVPLVIRNAGTNTNSDAVGIGFVNETSSNNYGNFYKSAIVHERITNFGVGSLHFLVDDGADGNSATMSETRMSITYQGNVGIGDVTPDAKLDVEGKTMTTDFQMTNGASNGYVLTSDATGNASWSNPASAIGTDVDANDGLNVSYPDIDVNVDNGLQIVADDVVLGGTLNQPTTIAQGNNAMIFNLTGTGDFEVRDNGSSALYVKDDGTIGINTNSPDATAILDIVSNSKGLLIPRLSNAQRNAITSPANSLIIYNTTSKCLEIYADNAWQSFYCSCPVLDPLQSIVGPDPVCSGSTVSFSVPGVTGAADYSWTVSGVPSGSITGNGSTTISFPAPASSTFSVAVTASNACNNSSSSQNTSVNAYTSVPPTPSASSAPSAICQGGSYNYAIVNNIGVNGTTSIGYTWTVTVTGTASATLTANSQTAVAGSPVTYTSTSTAVTLNIGASGSGTVTVSVVGYNTCGSSTTPLSWAIPVSTLSANPTSATAGSSTICNGQSTTLTLNGGGGGTGEVIRWYTSSCGGTLVGSGNGLSVSPTTTTTYFGRYEDPAPCNYNTICQSVTVTVDQLSIAPTSISGPTGICDGATATLNVSGGTLGTGAVVEWFTGSCGGTSAGTGSSITVSPTTNTTYYVQYNGNCNTTSCASSTVTVDQFTASNAGPDQTLCATSATLAGNTPTTGQGTWTVMSGTGTFSNANSPTSGVSGLSTGANVFRWTLPNGGCADSQDEVTITGQSSSVIPTGITGTTSICNGASTTLSVTGGSLGTGAVAEWFTGSCNGTSAGTGLSINVSPTSNTTYFVRYNGTCNTTNCISQSVTVDQFTASAAGIDQTVCATTATLDGNIPASGGGTWSLVSGSGTITTPTSATSGITGLGVGPNVFRWTLLNGGCSDSQDEVTITGEQATTSAAGTDQTVCSSSATLAGNTPVTGNGTWTLISGSGTITVPTSPTSSVTSLGLGANQFRWTLPNGSCTDSQDDVIITSHQFTTSNAGSDQTLCASSATLAGNAPATGVGTWSVVSGSGTFASANSPSSTVSSLGTGSNTFRWTLPNGVCTDSQDDVIITSHAFTAANAGPDQTVCTTTATLAGNTPATGVGTWSLISGSGSITSPNAANSGVTGLGVGANTFRWTLPNGDCSDSSDDVVITRNVPSTDPSSITGTTTIASGSTTTLSISGGSAGTSGVVRWYTGSCGGTLVHTGASYTTPALTSTTQYWVRYEDACGNSNCASATVTVTTGCTHTIRLMDTWGDGWNGATVTVTVNGTPVLTNITLASGSSQDFTFTASTGNTIVVTTTAWGSYPDEMRYTVSSSVGGTLVTNWAPWYNGNWSGTASCVACSSSSSSNVFYSATNTNSCTQNYATQNVNLCAGQTLTFGCGVNNNGNGDQYFRLYFGGTEVATNDDACGLRSNITYAVPTSGTYQMRFGCWNTGSCDGTVYYTITP